jgi:hypothetical protein
VRVLAHKTAGADEQVSLEQLAARVGARTAKNPPLPSCRIGDVPRRSVHEAGQRRNNFLVSDRTIVKGGVTRAITLPRVVRGSLKIPSCSSTMALS